MERTAIFCLSVSSPELGVVMIFVSFGCNLFMSVGRANG